MKKKLYFLAMILLIISCTSKNKMHIGKWEVINHNVEINQDEEIFIEIFDNTFQFIIDSEEMNGEYEIDYTRNPIWIDLFIDDERVKCIMEFFGNDSFRLVGDDEKRPDSFDDEDEMLIFKRIE